MEQDIDPPVDLSVLRRGHALERTPLTWVRTLFRLIRAVFSPSGFTGCNNDTGY